MTQAMTTRTTPKRLARADVEKSDSGAAAGAFEEAIGGESAATRPAPDRCERIGPTGGTHIQHGPLSDRVYVLHLADGDMPAVIPDLIDLAHRHRYGKIIAKIPRRHLEAFLGAGFGEEATIPQFFPSSDPRARDVAEREDAHFVAFFRHEARRRIDEGARIFEVLQACAQRMRRPAAARPARAAAAESVEPIGPEEAEGLARLYGAVFASYPFPIHDPAFLRAQMADDVHFFGIRGEDEQGATGWIAAASAEVDRTNGAAELTDFATRPSAQGRGCARTLLRALEAHMDRIGIPLGFTIARAVSHGMNLVFAGAGYECGGTLRNNTGIAGRLESMNVWHKRR